MLAFLLACLLACLLANKIIRTTKDIGSYFSDVMDVCQHATSYGIQHSQCKFTKKIPSNKEMVKILSTPCKQYRFHEFICKQRARDGYKPEVYIEKKSKQKRFPTCEDGEPDIADYIILAL